MQWSASSSVSCLARASVWIPTEMIAQRLRAIFPWSRLVPVIILVCRLPYHIQAVKLVQNLHGSHVAAADLRCQLHRVLGRGIDSVQRVFRYVDDPSLPQLANGRSRSRKFTYHSRR